MPLKDFFSKAPNLDAAQARRFMGGRMPGAYTLLDVRQPAEYEKSHIPGATLIPLPELHNRAGEIPKQKPVIAYCAVGGRSRAAAQLLKGQGFEEVYNLSGGIQAWDGLEASGPREWAFELAPEKDEPAEWLAMAKQLEYGLGRCYLLMADNVDDKQTAALLRRLADIEKIHQQHIEKMFEQLPPGQRGVRSLADVRENAFMEGGFSVEEFLARDRSHLQDREQTLQLAIALEAQALDLYSRFSTKTKSQQIRLLLMDIAGEEQAHITALGDMLDEILAGR